GVDHIVGVICGPGIGAGRAARGLLVGLRGGVHGRAGLLADLGQLVGGLLDGLDIRSCQGGLQRGGGVVDLALGLLGDLVSGLRQQLLGLVDQALAGVAGLGLLPALAVLLGVLLGFGHHPLDVVLAEAGAAGDRHRLGLAGGGVLGRDVDDAVRVD